MATDSADPTIFDAAQKEIWSLMEMDSYPKFICSDTYHVYKKGKQEPLPPICYNLPKSTHTAQQSKRTSLFQRKKPKVEQRLAEINAKAEQRRKRTESLILLQNFIQSKPPALLRDDEAPSWLLEHAGLADEGT